MAVVVDSRDQAFGLPLQFLAGWVAVQAHAGGVAGAEVAEGGEVLADVGGDGKDGGVHAAAAFEVLGMELVRVGYV